MTAIALTLISVPQASGATDTQLPGRNLAKVAPETAAVSEREKGISGTLVPSQARPGWTPARSDTAASSAPRDLTFPEAATLLVEPRVEDSGDVARSVTLAARRAERCKPARRAAVYFRLRTHTWQALRDGKLASKSPIVAGKSCHWAKFAAGEWQARARSARRSFYRWLNEKRVPVGESELRAYINDDCLEEIIDRESANTWSPTVRNYTDGRAYGLPQALPGWKMASAGSDWETNPKTQIAWMRGYVNGRYGGSCAALAHHNANGWY